MHGVANRSTLNMQGESKVGIPTCLFRRLGALSAAACWLAACAFGQDARGKILGLVTDASGAPVPAAVLSAVQIEMNTSTPARTNSTGNYELPFLLPGPYRLEIAAPGFKSFRQEPIEVRVGETATIDVKLEIGAVTETVKVTAEAPLIEESTASLGQTVERHQLENLPIGGDDIMYLLQLGAGITTTQTPGHNWLPSAVDVMSTATAGGTRSGSSEFSLDGIPNMTGTLASFAPPADIVSEFRVEVAKFDALARPRHGRARQHQHQGRHQPRPRNRQLAGSAQSMAGQRFLRQQATLRPDQRSCHPGEARSDGAAAQGQSLLLHVERPGVDSPAVRWPQPHLLDVRLPRASTAATRAARYLTVPTAEERRGDFSQLLAISSQYQIYDPATIRPATAGRFSRQPLAGNVLPASRLDPMAQRLLQFYPLPNQRGSVDFQDNYQVAGDNSNDFLQHMGRVDHVINERHRVFARGTYSWLNFYRNRYFNNEARGLNRYRHQRGVAIDDVYVVSPSFLVNLKYGMTWFNQPDGPYSVGYDSGRSRLPRQFRLTTRPAGRLFPADRHGERGQAGRRHEHQQHHHLSHLGSERHPVQGRA